MTVKILHEGKIKKGGVNDPPKMSKPTTPPPPQKAKRPTYEELVEALEEMASQYLTHATGEYMTHGFMFAGELCLDVLERLGKVKGADKIVYAWIKPPF